MVSTNVYISREDCLKIRGAIELIREALQPYLISLSPEERKSIPRLTNNSLAFIEKAVKQAERISNLPEEFDVREMRADMATVANLAELYSPLKKLCTDLNDTILFSGKEVFQSSIALYSFLNSAMTNGSPQLEKVNFDLTEAFNKIDIN